MDMQRDGSLRGGPMAFSGPWTGSDSMLGSPFVSWGQSGDVATGLLGGVAPSVGSRSEDLEAGAQDALGAVLESSELTGRGSGKSAVSDGSQKQKDFVDVPELFLCPITQVRKPPHDHMLCWT